MNFNSKTVSILMALSFITYTMNAKERRVSDLKPVIDAPTDTVIADELIPFKLSIGNSGPDKLVTGDGIIVVISTVQDGQARVIFSQTISGLGNDSIPFDVPVTWESTMSFPATQITQPTKIDLCTQIFSEGMLQNGDSIIMAYYDPNKSNNQTCNTITVMPQGTNAITDAHSSGNMFILYPNPADGRLYVDAAEQSNNGNTEMVIRDITGRAIRNQTYSAEQLGQGPVAINVAVLPRGLYTLSLQSGSMISTKKFSISR